MSLYSVAFFVFVGYELEASFRPCMPVAPSIYQRGCGWDPRVGGIDFGAERCDLRIYSKTNCMNRVQRGVASA